MIQQAYAKVTAPGSATAMVAVKNGQELRVANIGDSGFLVIRFNSKNEAFVARKSKE
jgi:serine/threonine protein phosphatase PrpC